MQHGGAGEGRHPDGQRHGCAAQSASMAKLTVLRFQAGQFPLFHASESWVFPTARGSWNDPVLCRGRCLLGAGHCDGYLTYISSFKAHRDPGGRSYPCHFARGETDPQGS